MSRRRPVVAIDGPAGAGKSTVSRGVAERLGYLLLDTGALYRAVALAATRAGALEDTARVGEVARDLAQRGAIRFAGDAASGQRVLLDGEDVSSAIRTPEMGQGASVVSAIPAVREALLSMQRAAGEQGAVVVEGRDIGTVVFPDGEAKFFLTASIDVRAERRHAELVRRGLVSDPGEVKQEVEQRDRRDSMRAVAPLRQADDAILVDSSEIGIDEVVECIVAHVREVERSLGG